jgi:hypothetical protein
MRELRIEEQKSILGGTRFEFTDLKTGTVHYSSNYQKLYNSREVLIKKGHDVTGITRFED